MSRHSIRGLPPNMVVFVGWDRALGFWCEIQRPGRPHVSYDATTVGESRTSIVGVLKTLIEAEVIAREDVADAELWLVDGDVNEIPEEHGGLRVAAEVIVHLREAAG